MAPTLWTPLHGALPLGLSGHAAEQALNGRRGRRSSRPRRGRIASARRCAGKPGRLEARHAYTFDYRPLLPVASIPLDGQVPFPTDLLLCRRLPAWGGMIHEGAQSGEPA